MNHFQCYFAEQRPSLVNFKSKTVAKFFEISKSRDKAFQSSNRAERGKLELVLIKEMTRISRLKKEKCFDPSQLYFLSVSSLVKPWTIFFPIWLYFPSCQNP